MTSCWQYDPGMDEGSADPTQVGGELTELAGVAEADTQSAYAWGLAEDDYEEPRGRRWPFFVTAIAVGVSLSLATIAGVLAYRYVGDKDASPTVAAPAPPSASTAPPAVPAAAPAAIPAPPEPTPVKLEGADGKFIAEMRGYGVPVSDQDPQWSANMAHAVCATVHDGGPTRYPPGTWVVMQLTDAVMTNNPGWNRQQASRFTNGAISHFCPEVWGRSKQEIAALPSDERFLAMLQDRLGITPVDNTLINAGHQMCVWKSQGWTTSQIVEATNSPNSPDEEQTIVEIAVDVFCPQYR